MPLLASRLCSAFMLLCFGSLSGCDQLSSRTNTKLPPMQAVYTQLIIPWHQEFARANKTLVERIERFCQNPANPGEYQEARSAWRESFTAWQAIKLLHFGPLAEDNLRLTIYFWPDHFNWVAKHLNNQLNLSEANSSELSNPSAALGLAELEYLLFDTAYTDSAALAGRPCDLLRSASNQINTRAAELLSAWQEGKRGAWQAPLLTPGSDAEKRALSNLLESLITSFSTITEEELIAPIGSLNAPVAKPFLSQAWRANLGKSALLAELKSANALLHLGLAPLLNTPSQQALQRVLKEQLNQLSADLTNTPGELVFLINTEQGRTQLTQTAEQVQKITAILRAIAQTLAAPPGEPSAQD